MPPLVRASVALAGLVTLVAPGLGLAQQQPMNMPQAKSTAPYHPGLGDLMTAYVQPRHIKLGLAGQEQNWDYAAYELGELRETFDDVAKLVPKHGKLSIPEALASTVKMPLDSIAAAVKAKDQAAFTN